jgi:hypothetical protein
MKFDFSRKLPVLSLLMALSFSCKQREFNTSQAASTDSTTSPRSQNNSSSEKVSPLNIVLIVTPVERIEKLQADCEKANVTESPTNGTFEAISLCVQEKRIDAACWNIYRDMEETNGKYLAIMECVKSIQARLGLAEVTLAYPEWYKSASEFIDPSCPRGGSAPSAASTKCLRAGKVTNICQLATKSYADRKKADHLFAVCRNQLAELGAFAELP